MTVDFTRLVARRLGDSWYIGYARDIGFKLIFGPYYTREDAARRIAEMQAGSLPIGYEVLEFYDGPIAGEEVR